MAYTVHLRFFLELYSSVAPSHMLTAEVNIESYYFDLYTAPGLKKTEINESMEISKP